MEGNGAEGADGCKQSLVSLCHLFSLSLRPCCASSLQLTKVRLGDDPRGRGKQLFGLRLKNTGYTRALLRKDGVRFGLSTEELSAALVAPLPEKKKEEAAVSVVADKVPAEAASAAAGAGASATGASTDSGKGKSFWQRFTGTRS